MESKRHLARLGHMIEAIDHIHTMTGEGDPVAFGQDWRTRWAVERALEIISEASRHLPDELKLRHPDIPWRKIAAIGNVLRHDYQEIAPPILWKIAREDLRPLEMVCREELGRSRRGISEPSES